MTWNYRLVHESEFELDKVMLQEVFYNQDGSPSEYGDCFRVQGETLEEVQEIFNRMSLDFKKPVLTKKDFNNG